MLENEKAEGIISGLKTESTGNAWAFSTSDDSTIDVDAMRADAIALLAAPSDAKREHTKVLQDILDDLEPIDFRELGNLDSDERVSQKIQIVLTIQEILRTAKELNCGLCRRLDFIYVFNGEFWRLIDKNELEDFLGEAAERLGVDAITAKYHKTKKELVSQFLADARLPTPEKLNESVLIMRWSNFPGHKTLDRIGV